MLIIREKFIAKPGQASKLAKLMHDLFGHDKNFQVMTDLTGSFNTVVMETRIKDLAEFERRMQEYAADPAYKQKMVGYTDLFYAGTRQIFRLVE